MTEITTSIVIASFSSIKHLSKCLQSLHPVPNNTEIIVSTVFTEDEVEPLKKYSANFIYNPNERNLNSIQRRETRVFRLRSQGLKVAKGKFVTLLEDHCEVTENWLSAMRDTLSDCNCIAGGPVINGAESSLFSWALYWSEFSTMMPPFPIEGLKSISAVNSAYHKVALDKCEEIWEKGFYDNEVHDALIELGGQFCPSPDAVVKTSLPFSFSQAVVHLYTGGQRYGGYRGGKEWSITRVVRLLSTFLVPAVLLIRIFKLTLARQPKTITTFILASPILYILLSAWGFGEFYGTFHGRKS